MEPGKAIFTTVCYTGLRVRTLVLYPEEQIQTIVECAEGQDSVRNLMEGLWQTFSQVFRSLQTFPTACNSQTG